MVQFNWEQVRATPLTFARFCFLASRDVLALILHRLRSMNQRRRTSLTNAIKARLVFWANTVNYFFCNKWEQELAASRRRAFLLPWRRIFDRSSSSVSEYISALGSQGSIHRAQCQCRCAKVPNDPSKSVPCTTGGSHCYLSVSCRLRRNILTQNMYRGRLRWWKPCRSSPSTPARASSNFPARWRHAAFSVDRSHSFYQ